MSCPASRPSGRSCESTSREALRLASPSRWSLPRSASVALAFVAALAGADANALTVVDDAGHAFVFERPPQRIVTLAPSLTELVFAAGGGASLVATSALSDYPPAARTIARVGDAGRLDVERVIALKPDLVLFWQRGNTSRQLEQLEAAGIRLFHLEPRRLADVARAIERLGTLLGHEAEANRRANEMRAALERLRAAHAGAAPVTVFYQVWRQPLMTINGKQLIDDIITLCGGRNVFAEIDATGSDHLDRSRRRRRSRSDADRQREREPRSVAARSGQPELRRLASPPSNDGGAAFLALRAERRQHQPPGPARRRRRGGGVRGARPSAHGTGDALAAASHAPPVFGVAARFSAGGAESHQRTTAHTSQSGRLAWQT